VDDYVSKRDSQHCREEHPVNMIERRREYADAALMFRVPAAKAATL
jgi:hypothetical protein